MPPAETSCPLLCWKEASGLSWEQLAAAVSQRLGREVKPRTLEHIARRRRRPSYPLALALSAVTKIDVEEWRTYGPHGEPSRPGSGGAS